MTQLSEARAVERATAARHARLCAAYDRGEPVHVQLRLADLDWIRAKAALAVLDPATDWPSGGVS